MNRGGAFRATVHRQIHRNISVKLRHVVLLFAVDTPKCDLNLRVQVARRRQDLVESALFLFFFIFFDGVVVVVVAFCFQCQNASVLSGLRCGQGKGGRGRGNRPSRQKPSQRVQFVVQQVDKIQEKFVSVLLRVTSKPGTVFGDNGFDKTRQVCDRRLAALDGIAEAKKLGRELHLGKSVRRGSDGRGGGGGGGGGGRDV